jgi:hypothetical protein
MVSASFAERVTEYNNDAIKSSDSTAFGMVTFPVDCGTPTI